MKRITIFCLLTVTFSLLAESAFAQLAYTPGKVFSMYLNKNSLHYDGIKIHNQGALPVSLHWTLVSVDTIPGSYFDFCASGDCYIGIPQVGTFPVIQPSDSGWAAMHFWTGNTVGTCKAVVFVYEQGNEPAGDTLTFFLHVTEPNSTKKSEKKSTTWEVFPNPATDYFQLPLGNTQYTYSLFDITGKSVLKGTALGNTKVSVVDLPYGVYMLNITDESGQVHTKKIVRAK